jgi:hypothetical protein
MQKLPGDCDLQFIYFTSLWQIAFLSDFKTLGGGACKTLQVIAGCKGGGACKILQVIAGCKGGWGMQNITGDCGL